MKPWHHWLILFLYSVFEHFLAKSEKFVAKSTWGLIFNFFKRRRTMSFSKVIQLGSAGSLTVSEAAGVATVKVSVGMPVASGAVNAVASAEVDVQAAEVVQLALDLLKSKLPASVQSLVTDLENVAIPALKNV
jgi:hypothetical protein